MNKIVFLIIPLVSSCSEIPGFTVCDEAVKANLLQEVFEKNLDVFFSDSKGYRLSSALSSCSIGNSPEDLCDKFFEAKETKKILSNEFYSSCSTAVRYSLRLNEDKYKAKRKKIINEIDSYVNNLNAKSKDLVLATFESYGVLPSESDIIDGISKRKSSIQVQYKYVLDRLDGKKVSSPVKIEDDFSDLLRTIGYYGYLVASDSRASSSYYLVADLNYKVSKSKDFLNLDISEFKLLTEGQ